MNSGDQNFSEEIKALTRGPCKISKRYNTYYIKGYKFHTFSRDKNKKTQNYGIVNFTESGNQSYYRRITDIYDIDYYWTFRIVLFKCESANITTGMKKNEFGFNIVNFSKLVHSGERLEYEPFVFSSQVQQIFYVRSQKNSN
ncbi:hypothetical protein AXF42_Ash013983 [Apostasia shenzhenica]|uniref:DUF4216 domain-containing protein n=1 Tax=Apostasia shenzhenica TaxID=1088818 RepID=A0A2I0A928_9ASPA|nr:hypothetical protein AXF42_Ash013983 [Apostasia shenzhenica]